MRKSFLVLFFKKERLAFPCLHERSNSACGYQAGVSYPAFRAIRSHARVTEKLA